MRLTVPAVLVLALAGCSSGERAAQSAATALDEALRAGDAVTACGLLAPATRSELERTERAPCAQALPALELAALPPATSVERYGRHAALHVRTADGRPGAWFLSRFGERWLVVAAGCVPRGELPAACAVEGP